MAQLTCSKCSREQPATPGLTQCVYCGAALTEAETTPADEPVPQVSASPAAPTVPPAAEEPVPEGKRRCEGCGEVLYATERRCWRCGRELPPEVAEEPVTAEPAPPAPIPVAAPSALPAAATPPPVTPTAVPAPPLDPAAQALGIWSLVLALLGFVCCPPIIPSIIAIVLGVKARKRGASPLGIAGIVIGVVGLVIYVPTLLLVLIGLFAAGTPTPEATSWLWSLPCPFA
ncbi:DUF4190 domain-containing protein [bacterium]|nr:DUF4190 domain-containing protein [bacterium]